MPLSHYWCCPASWADKNASCRFYWWNLQFHIYKRHQVDISLHLLAVWIWPIFHAGVKMHYFRSWGVFARWRFIFGQILNTPYLDFGHRVLWKVASTRHTKANNLILLVIDHNNTLCSLQISCPTAQHGTFTVCHVYEVEIIDDYNTLCSLQISCHTVQHGTYWQFAMFTK